MHALGYRPTHTHYNGVKEPGFYQAFRSVVNRSHGVERLSDGFSIV